MTALVLGAGGLVAGALLVGLWGFALGLPGVVLGVLGLRQARRTGGDTSIAVAGLVASIIATAAFALFLVAYGDELWRMVRAEVNQMSPSGSEEIGLPPPPELPTLGGQQLGQPATVGNYTVNVTSLTISEPFTFVTADGQTVYDAQGDAVQGVHVQATLSAVYRGMTEGVPVDDLWLAYPGSDNTFYGTEDCTAPLERPIEDVGTLDFGVSAEFDACVTVTVDVLQGAAIVVGDQTLPAASAKLWSTP